MAVDEHLMDLIVDLVVSDSVLAEFHDATKRQQLMKDRGLSVEAIAAINDKDGNEVERLLNTQIVIPVRRPGTAARKKAKGGRKGAKKAGGRSAKKAGKKR